jgi:hypothetical protein
LSELKGAPLSVKGVGSEGARNKRLSEPKGAPLSGLTREGARNERPSEEGRQRVKAPGGEQKAQFS